MVIPRHLNKIVLPISSCAMSAAARDAASLSLVHRDLQKVCSSSLVAPLHAGGPSNRHPSTQQYTKAHVTSVRVTLQNKSAKKKKISMHSIDVTVPIEADGFDTENITHYLGLRLREP